ncbi:MAG: D-alanyl-D-alanine carboxypeptidase [Oscillospiraceae bacterium]|nr:D-alanyl-D-alanine carboxypeptidase [Oscillospiraceae bacterium]
MRLKTKRKAAACLAAMVVWASPVQGADALLTQPEVGAKSAVVMEALTGRVVFWQQGDTPMPMASTTKIMTTLLALEQQNLDDPFVVDGGAIRVEGSSMGLREGDTVTLRALCYGMMLASGNDAANAAAVCSAGSMEAFVEQMNERAAQLGMKDTHFVTPSGLDAEGHQSTAYDMALLMRAALQVPQFCEIAAAKTARLEYGNPPYARSLTNHNKLLWNCEGVMAGKTGFTKGAGRCLVSAAEREGISLICVTLGCPDDWNVHAQLYDRCFGLLQPVELTAGQVCLPVVGGESPVEVQPQEELILPLTAEEADMLEIKVLLPRFVYAPVKRGDLLGRLECRVGDTVFYTCPLVAQQDAARNFEPTAEKPCLWERLLAWVKK